MSRTSLITRSLLASTALVAVAAGANAQTINSGASTTAVLTSATSLNQNFTSTARWAVATGPAVEISGSGAVVISVTTGGVVSSSAITGTIAVQADTGITGVTINNSGTLVNSNADGVVVSSTATAADASEIGLTVINAGTISGSTTNGSIRTAGGDDTLTNTGTIRGLVNLGAGNNAVTMTSGTLVGNLTTTGGDDTLTMTSGGILTGDVNLGAGTNDISINHSTITGNITTTGGDDTFGLLNSGTVTGDVNLGAGTNEITINSSTVTGNITTTTGDDTFGLINSGTVTGDVDLGAGDNVVTISNSTLRGTLTLDSGNDTLNIIGNANVTDTITLGDGSNVMNVSNSTVRNILGGANADVLSLLNANVSGTINLGAGGSDVLNISGSTAFTTKGAISNAETVNVSATTMNLQHGLSGVNTLRVNTGSTFNVSNSFNTAAAGTIINDGTFRIGAGKTVSAATVDFVGGNLTIDVVSATSAGKLVVGSDSAGMTATSITINLAPSSNFIASGTALTIVDGSATATLDANTLTSTGRGVHTFSLARAGSGNEDILLTIGRVSTSSLINGESGQNIANLLDTLGNSVTGTLVDIQSAITQAQTSAEVNNIVESLTPGLDGIGAANLGMTQATGGQISNRLASLRTGVAAGDALATRNMWVEGFGALATQDTKDGVKGYESTGGGVTFGMDSDAVVDGANVGAAFTYGAASVDSDASNNAQTDITSYIGSLYGSRVFDSGTFLNTQMAFGWNTYDMERTVSGVGTAYGETDGWQAALKGEVGRDMVAGNWTLTPSLGAQATYLDMDGYTETGVGAANLIVNPDAMTTLDLTAGARVAYTMPLGSGGILRPSLRAGVTTRVGDTNMDATSRFTSVATTFATPGVEADRTSYNLGAGLLLGSAGGMDLSMDYDADIRSNYTGHTGKLKARFAF